MQFVFFTENNSYLYKILDVTIHYIFKTKHSITYELIIYL